jgi:adenylate kinase
MLAERGHSVDAVLLLTVDEDEVVERLAKRARDEGRSDDTEDVIRHRQEVYTEQTAPLIETYDERGILVRIDGMGAVQEVTSRVFDALDETNGATAS